MTSGATRFSLIVFLSACGLPSDPGRNTTWSPPAVAESQQVLTTFTGVFQAATEKITLIPQQAWDPAFRALIPVDQNGLPGDGAADHVELVTTNLGSDLGACGRAAAFCGDVTVRSFFATQELRGLCAEITQVTTGHEAIGGQPSIESMDGSLGLWCYGSLGVAGSPSDAATRTWKFDSRGGDFVFQGRVMATLAAPAAPTEDCGVPGDEDGDGHDDCADAECAGTGFCGEVCGNGVDDDGDMAIDCNDPDCASTYACNESCEYTASDTTCVSLGCDWFEGQCYTNACEFLLNQTACDANAQCVWLFTACFPVNE